MTDDIAALSASALIHAYRARRLSPVEVTEAVLARLRRAEPHVNAFTLVDEEAALAAGCALRTGGWCAHYYQGSDIDPGLAHSPGLAERRSRAVLAGRCSGERPLT